MSRDYWAPSLSKALNLLHSVRSGKEWDASAEAEYCSLLADLAECGLVPVEEIQIDAPPSA